MNKNSDTIISTYEQANKDATELLNYIETISKPEQFRDSNLPTLVKKLEDKDSDVALKYIRGASIMGGSVAAAIGTSISTGMLASSLSVGGTMALGGMSMIPGLNLFVVPALALPLALKLLADSKVKKYIKENKEELKKKKNRLHNGKEKLLAWLKEVQEQAIAVNLKLQEEIKIKFSEYRDKTKKLASDVSVQIDDCLNTNTNKRILQYNEIILKQYKLQKELEEKVDFLFEEYNKLLEQKQELERQINCLLKLLNAMGCPESVINQALNESEA